MFVHESQEKWHPWWKDLYRYALGFAVDLQWEYEPVQRVLVARPTLSTEQRTDLGAFLRTAPDEQVSEHTTLRRATGLTLEQQSKLAIVYFAEAVGSSVADAPNRAGTADGHNGN
jgi:hypothetical protein